MSSYAQNKLKMLKPSVAQIKKDNLSLIDKGMIANCNSFGEKINEGLSDIAETNKATRSE